MAKIQKCPVLGGYVISDEILMVICRAKQYARVHARERTGERAHTFAIVNII